MGKFPSPSCCFSCACFSSSSQPSQQPPNAGPSIPLSSSQPSQQQPNAGPSTPLSSSQPSQQHSNAGPSTPAPSQQPATGTDLKSFLHKFNDITQLDDLIKFIEDLLKIASGEKIEGGSSSEVSSYIQDGQAFLEFVDKHMGKLPQEKDSIDGLRAETQKVLIDLMEGAGKIHWVGVALSVVGFVLARFNQMSDNKRECLEILRDMVNLGRQIGELNEEMPEQKQKLNEAVECIVVGCCMCTSQLATSKIFRFLTSSVTADSLKAFQLRIERLYSDLQMWGIIDIQKRLPKIASQSQKLYANEGAVGIDSARDEVIRLLDLSAQHTSAIVVVVHGFGGIGKTTLTDAVYAHIDLHSYKHCRIHIDQNCTKNDLKVLQEQILNGLFERNVKLANCDHGRGLIKSLSLQNPNQPLFLYIDNGLKSTDLKELLLRDLGWLPVKSRILVTTRNLHETGIFVSTNIQRQQYAVIPLPDREGREILLKKVSDYNDEKNIQHLLDLCGGVPLLLELAGSQLAMNSTSKNYIVLEMLRQGEKVEEEDISDRMVDFVYHRLLPPIQEAFLDIACFYSRYESKGVAYIVGEEEFRALEEASLVKTGELGEMIVHDIVEARGKKMSEGSRITEPESLRECLKDEEKLKNLKGIYFMELFEQSPIEISEYHLNCMSNSLRTLWYLESQITFRGKCHRPFKQLGYLTLPRDISDLPMEFEKLERLGSYFGPLMQGMSLYQLPPNLRNMCVTNIICSESRIANSINSPQLAQDSSLVTLVFWKISTMERLPDGVEKLTKLEELTAYDCPKLRELPSTIGELRNLEKLDLELCHVLEEWPLSFRDLSNLKTLKLYGCSSKLKESLPSNIRENCKMY